MFRSYEPYFRDSARRQDVAAALTYLTLRATDRAAFLKGANGRYDIEVSRKWQLAMQFLGCLLVYNCERGGVATFMLIEEAEQAKQEGADRFVVTVAKHKTMWTYGPVDVVLRAEDMELVKSCVALRKRLASCGGAFKSSTLIVDLDGEDLRKLYPNIQKWAKDNNVPGTFSSQAMRRTVTTLAYQLHTEEFKLRG